MGKFMELYVLGSRHESIAEAYRLLYTNTLLPPDLCPHTLANRSKPTSLNRIIRYIRSSSYVFSITIGPVTVLDIRLPKLQVGPIVAKRKTSENAPVKASTDGHRRGEAENEIKETFSRDCEDT